MFKVIGHGNPYGIRQGDRMLNAEELADMIRQSGDYVGGKQKIILFSCSTGREPDGLARQLADILNVEVIAPSTEVRPTKLGIFIACEEQFVEGQSKYVRGKWNIFMPRK